MDREDVPARITADRIAFTGALVPIVLAMLMFVSFVAPSIARLPVPAQTLTLDAACGLLLLGVASAALFGTRTRRRIAIVCGALASVVGAIAGVRFVVHAIGARTTITAVPLGGMDGATAMCLLVTGATVAARARSPRHLPAFAIANTIAFSFGLTTLLAYALRVTAAERIHAQMPLLVAAAFAVYGGLMLAHAWREESRPEGTLPSWSPVIAAIAAAMLSVSVIIAVQGNAGLLQAAIILGAAGKFGSAVHKNLQERRADRARVAREQRARSVAEAERDIAVATTDAAREQQRWLEYVLDVMPLPLVLFDPESRAITFANKAADAFAGGSFPRRLEAPDAIAFVDPLGTRIDATRTPFARVAAHERLDASETLAETRTGRVPLLVHGALLPAACGHAPTGVLAFQDISRLRHAEGLSARLGRILDHSSNEIYAFDAETWRIVQANAGTQRNLGYSAEELFALTPLALCAGLDESRFATLLEPLRTGERDQVVFETEHRRRGGTTYPVEMRVHLSRTEQPPVFVAVVQNIAERKNAEHARGTFVANAFRDLEMPLGLLEIELESLMRTARRGQIAAMKPERIAHMLESAERQVRTVRRFVGDLLDPAEVVSGRVALTLEEVDLSSVVCNVVAHFGDEIAMAGSEIHLRADEPVVGRWDRFRLEQAVSQLISNAIKYGRGKPIDVAVTAQSGTARVTVADQGIGMTADQLRRVFTLAERTVPARQYGAIGLGLYLAKAIVDALGGSIQVQSEVGRGSTFVIELPRSARRAA
jgi:PAS domain S-box-containing protein